MVENKVRLASCPLACFGIHHMESFVVTDKPSTLKTAQKHSNFVFNLSRWQRKRLEPCWACQASSVNKLIARYSADKKTHPWLSFFIGLFFNQNQMKNRFFVKLKRFWVVLWMILEAKKVRKPGSAHPNDVKLCKMMWIAKKGGFTARRSRGGKLSGRLPAILPFWNKIGSRFLCFWPSNHWALRTVRRPWPKFRWICFLNSCFMKDWLHRTEFWKTKWLVWIMWWRLFLWQRCFLSVLIFWWHR